MFDSRMVSFKNSSQPQGDVSRSQQEVLFFHPKKVHHQQSSLKSGGPWSPFFWFRDILQHSQQPTQIAPMPWQCSAHSNSWPLPLDVLCPHRAGQVNSWWPLVVSNLGESYGKGFWRKKYDHLVMTFTVSHGKIHPFLIGKPSISMGHLYHGYVK